MITSAMDDGRALDLLLARANGEALLDGLGAESLVWAKHPSIDRSEGPPHLAHDGDPNDMDQGWGVLYPEGEDALWEAIVELRIWRQQGIDDAHARRDAAGSIPQVLKWAIPPGKSAREFLNSDYGRTPKQRPLYLLILGDLDQIPLEFQQGLAIEALVGRLCLPSADDYAVYARKVVTSERERVETARPRLVLMSTSVDGRPDGAVDLGHNEMIVPLAEDFTDPELELGLDENLVQLLGPKGRKSDARDWQGVCAALREPHPSVFLSLSHGVGDPSWSFEQQRQRQGQMWLGSKALDPDDVARGRFLPRGIWFNYACFGGGSPKSSAFEPWLRRLVGAKVWARVPDVLGTLAREHPFVARQPQLALANPDGPLAIIAHADLAFTYGFRRQAHQDQSSRSRRAKARPDHGPIRDVLQTLAAGNRAGLALSKLRRALDDADQALLEQWDRREANESALVRLLIEKSDASSAIANDEPSQQLLSATRKVIGQVGRSGVTLDAIAQQAGKPPHEIVTELGHALDMAALAHMGQNWMAHHDLSGWFLLGDPAVRVPVAGHHPSGTTPIPP